MRVSRRLSSRARLSLRGCVGTVTPLPPPESPSRQTSPVFVQTLYNPACDNPVPCGRSQAWVQRTESQRQRTGSKPQGPPATKLEHEPPWSQHSPRGCGPESSHLQDRQSLQPATDLQNISATCLGASEETGPPPYTGDTCILFKNDLLRLTPRPSS